MIDQARVWLQPGVATLGRWKRSADAKFGNYSRLAQFCAVGASGMVVDLSFYAVFQRLYETTWLGDVATPFLKQVPLAIAVASVSSILLALVWNFLLNRRLTFNDARRHDQKLLNQFGAYVLGNSVAILISLAFRVGLPNFVPFFRNHYHSAALVGIIAATGVSFSMARWVVFRAHKKDGEKADL